jgi:uncharacterized delta-60 repeat protein
MKIFIAAIALLISNVCLAQISTQWETTINGGGDYGDQYLSVASDASNNVYAVGSTVRTNSDRDLLIVKFNSQAQVIWKKIFSAPGNGPDEAKKVLIHPNGNIVVSGYGNNKSVGNDFWTLMLNPDGDSVWTALYNSPQTNLYDEPNAMCFDAQGNIIITGESDQDPTGFLNNDFLTIKYSATGSLLWAAKYNSTFNDNDRSMSVATDNSNNIYITGRSFNGTDDDLITIKYNSSGTQQWIKSFDNGGIDRPVSIGLDNQGKIYVAARSSNGTDDDYRIIAYNAQGTQQFNVTYDFAGHDRPSSMAVIPAGGCIVTGRSDANPATGINYDILTISYSASGTQQWMSTYAGTANNDDIPTDIHLSSDGKVVVTGYTDMDNTVNINNNVITLTYSANGGSLITQNFNGPGNNDDEGQSAIFCPNGNVAVVGFVSDAGLQRNAQLLIYSSNSAATSQNTFSGYGDNSQNVRDLVFDNSGNSYICGYSVTKDNNRDFYVAKLNTTGTVLWSADTTGTLFGSDEESNAIALDNSGNICVSGFLKNSGTSSDIYVEKYNTSGSLLWNFGFDGTIHESDRSYDMALDNSGNIYLCGKTDVDPTWQVNDDILLLKISNSGTLAWSKVFASSSLLDKGQHIRLNAANEIIVAGKISNGSNDNIVVLKYANNGTLIWSYTLDCHGANDRINDMEILPNGNIAICGQAQLAVNSLDYDGFVSVITAAGQQQWIQYTGNTGETLDEINAITLGTNSSIWAAGSIDSDASNIEHTNCLMAHYDQNGVLDANGIVSNNANNSNYADDIIVDNQDHPLMACHTNTGQNGDVDYQMEFLTLDGSNFISAYQRNISDTIDVANVLKLDATNNIIYCGGSSWTIAGQRDALVGKYNWTTTINIDENLSQIQIFPVPATDAIQIQGISNQEMTRIEIYSMQGELVYSSNYNAVLNNVKIDISNLPSGAYVLSLMGPKLKSTYPFIKSSL